MTGDDLLRSPVLYSSPPHKRRVARALASLGFVLLAFAVWFAIDEWRRGAVPDLRAAYGLIAFFITPLVLIGVGLWVGWGHTRVDLWRKCIERRPFGLPWPAKQRPLSDAQRLYVAFHRGSSAT